MDLNTNMTFISEHFVLSIKNNLQKPLVIVKADRLSGKTEMLCTLASKLALQSYKVCIVFSSKHLALSGMQRVISLLPNAKIIGNQIHHVGGGWVNCGKNVVDDADIFMVDDLGYMNPTVFFEYLVPKLCINKPMLFIGTPTGNTKNLMARLCKVKNKDGNNIFNVIDITQTGQMRSLL